MAHRSTAYPSPVQHLPTEERSNSVIVKPEQAGPFPSLRRITSTGRYGALRGGGLAGSCVQLLAGLFLGMLQM